MTSILFHNGFIHSPADPFAEAILIENGVIAWLGAQDSASGFMARADKVVDLEGALVTPGFVDSHVHLLETALSQEAINVGPDQGGNNADRVLELLAPAARAWQPHDGALCATGYDDSSWGSSSLTQDQLDQAFPGVPLYVPRADLHSALVSSALLELLAVSRDGAPLGIIRDATHMAVRTAIRDLPAARREQLYTRVLAESARQGIVSVHENNAPGIDTRAGLAQLLELTREPASGLPHVVGYLGELMTSQEQAREVAAQIPGLNGFAGDLSVDGSLGSHSAALRAPYTDRPQTSGTLHLGEHEIAQHLVATTQAGLTAGFHVIGDRALDTTLAGFVLACEQDPGLKAAMRRLGHRLEHVEFADAAAIAQFIEYGIGLSVQPAFDSFWGGPGGLYESRLGAQRTRTTTPLRDFLAAGIAMGFGSDSPVTPIDPWGGVAAALFHNNPEQRVSARAAFRAHTRGAWRIAGFNQGHGDLRIGSPADLAIWRASELGVQAENQGRSSWTTDARSGSPLLPILGPDAGPVQCLATFRSGVELYSQLG